MGDRLLGEALLSRVPHGMRYTQMNFTRGLMKSLTVPPGQQQTIPSAFSPDGSSPSVSAIWSWDAQHKLLTPHWINPTGGKYHFKYLYVLAELKVVMVYIDSVITLQIQGAMQWYSNTWYLPVVMSGDWTDKGSSTRVVRTASIDIPLII